ncbi:hypothetical protein DM860_012807 [Cuscuta australis]|uniref:Uncharacterized protein n=1 Tax=Cuscuta australis TaxID=267555 RepID=A0A328DUJ0_9ASTE|nr:hypothetical protein DM860_012807 [Cuscuta australis]
MENENALVLQDSKVMGRVVKVRLRFNTSDVTLFGMSGGGDSISFAMMKLRNSNSINIYANFNFQIIFYDKILMNAKKRGPASALNATARIHGVITNALDLLYMGDHDTCISECLFLLLFFKESYYISSIFSSLIHLIFYNS